MDAGVSAVPALSAVPVGQCLIVLSFAPSAAAVWHSDRGRITCERNSGRQSVCVKRWAGQFVIIIHVVEFKADATAATHEQMQQIIKKHQM